MLLDLLPYLAPVIWAVASILLSLLLTWGMIRAAPRLGLIDYPSDRKVHLTPTPRGGGVAIFLAFACFLAFSGGHVAWLMSSDFLMLTFFIVLLGAADDRRPLPWYLRLAVQGAVGGMAVWTCPMFSCPAERLAALFWIVGLINACNMLDNMDALSAGTTWIIAAGMLLADWLAGGASLPISPEMSQVIFLGALAGFLWFNRPPARIFMGDSGSTFLGFYLGIVSIHLACSVPASSDRLAGVGFLCAVPWYDLLSVVTIRLAQGRSPFHADKQHLSHRLVMRGYASTAAVRIILLLTLATASYGLLIYAVRSWQFGALLGLLGILILGRLFWYDLHGILELTQGKGREQENSHEQAQKTPSGNHSDDRS